MTPSTVRHHRVLGVAVPGLAGFESPNCTYVAVIGVEQAIDLLTVVDFDLLLVGEASVGPAVARLTRWLRATTACPRWAVVTTDLEIERSARALGAVAVLSDIHDPRLPLLLDSLHTRSVSA